MIFNLAQGTEFFKFLDFTKAQKMPFMIIQMQIAEGIEYFKFQDFTKAHNNAIHDHSDAVS